MFPKLCRRCNRSHSAADWHALAHPVKGSIQYVDGVPVLEMRNCPCGSTLAIPVEDEREAA